MSYKPIRVVYITSGTVIRVMDPLQIMLDLNAGIQNAVKANKSMSLPFVIKLQHLLGVDGLEFISKFRIINRIL